VSFVNPAHDIHTFHEAKGFLTALALSFRPVVFAAGDLPPARRLYVITEGAAIYNGRSLSKGMCWGEADVMLQGDKSTRMQAYAVTYLHCQFIGPDEINALRERFPLAWGKVRSSRTSPQHPQPRRHVRPHQP
jgi:hypothetical protein